jgi:hypothetical protein
MDSHWKQQFPLLIMNSAQASKACAAFINNPWVDTSHQDG